MKIIRSPRILICEQAPRKGKKYGRTSAPFRALREKPGDLYKPEKLEKEIKEAPKFDVSEFENDDIPF